MDAAVTEVEAALNTLIIFGGFAKNLQLRACSSVLSSQHIYVRLYGSGELCRGSQYGCATTTGQMTV